MKKSEYPASIAGAPSPVYMPELERLMFHILFTRPARNGPCFDIAFNVRSTKRAIIFLCEIHMGRKAARMQTYQAVFRRHELKYLLTATQYRELRNILAAHMCPDAYPTSTIANLYYDTPDFRLVRTSMEKPAYKEKLRLRTYEPACAETPAFVEIKKKFAGVVYKRRQQMPYQQALNFLAGQSGPGKRSQITRELEWFLHLYRPLAPAMFIYYNRVSLRGVQDEQLRITFDASLRWRAHELDLRSGTHGTALLAPGQVLMEVKAAGAMPLWLAQALAELHIYPHSFSKYGQAYCALQRKIQEGRWASA